MKKIFKICIMVLTLLILTSCAEGKTEDKFIDGLRSSVVMIYSGESHGSGVIIRSNSDEIVIATVAHVIKDNDQVIITFESGKAGFAEVFYCDTVSDVCLLKINAADFYDNYNEQLVSANVAKTEELNLSQEDVVYLVGSAMNVGANVTSGRIGSTDYYVADYDSYMLYLYADAMPGMSGSGCFSEDGRLIGVLSSGSESSEVLCVKIDKYLNVLK